MIRCCVVVVVVFYFTSFVVWDRLHTILQHKVRGIPVLVVSKIVHLYPVVCLGYQCCKLIAEFFLTKFDRHFINLVLWKASLSTARVYRFSWGHRCSQAHADRTILRNSPRDRSTRGVKSLGIRLAPQVMELLLRNSNMTATVKIILTELLTFNGVQPTSRTSFPFAPV